MDNVEKNKAGLLERFKQAWRQNPLFSTGMALIVMIIVQTLALTMNSNFTSFGDWFQNWLFNWISLLRNN